MGLEKVGKVGKREKGHRRKWRADVLGQAIGPLAGHSGQLGKKLQQSGATVGKNSIKSNST